MTEAQAQPFNPFDPAVQRDPYPFYHQLRETNPVMEFPGFGYMLTRWEDCNDVLRDTDRWSADRQRSNRFAEMREQMRAQMSAMGVDGDREPPKSMLTSDPPDHTRLRNLVNKAFTARRVAELKPRVQEIVDGLLDEIASKGEAEIVQDLAYPVPMTVIAEMLGVPYEDRTKFQEWTNEIAVSLDPVLSPEQQRKAMEAGQALGEYFTGIVAERRKQPRDDLISALIDAEDHGEMLTEAELIGMCNLLLIAGHETTVNLIGNGLNALLRHPDKLEQLRGNPSLDRSAIEELLRFDGPVGFTGRVATEDVQIGDTTVHAGESVITILLAANRDPAVFEDPDDLRLDRMPNPHLALGGGIHFCLGAPLAKLEAQVALGSLLRRFAKIELAEEPEPRGTIVLRGLKSLRVSCS